MCGLISVILKDNTKVMNKDMVEMFKQMLYADALRGWDSTGIACIKGNGDNISILKDNCAAGPFLFRHKDSSWGFQNRGIIGHNRWATRGLINADNAHPFHEGHIILAHNGTLNTYKQLKDVDVDSHAICHAINEQGAIPVLEKLDGAFALIWYNQKTKEFYATRNKERPLSIVETDDLFIIASEVDLIKWICSRNNFKIRRITNCNPGTLYSFKESKANRIYIDTTKYKPLEPEPFKYYKPDPPALPSPKVVQIKPHSDFNLAEGDLIEVLFWKQKVHAYESYKLGKVQWEVDLLEQVGNCKLEVYTKDDTDYSEQVGTVEVVRTYFNSHDKQYVVIATNPTVKKKEVADENGPITTSNGVKLTQQVVAKVSDTQCIFCQAPFNELHEHEFHSIVLNPHAQKGHIYKYVYYCPACVDFFNMHGKRSMVG